jgi:hypothetical protein
VTVRARRPSLGIAGAAALLLLFLLLLASAPAGAAQTRGAAQRLAEAYAPIVMLREQEDPPCDTSGEQYQPTSVDVMLDNPKVTLTRPKEDGEEELVARAPTAEDIAGLGDEYHLNIPGDPLGDTCVYARDFARLKREGKAPAITYAHIAHENGSSGLALQYWFFWYFNQFNDLHEGDWEGMQLVFEGDTAAEAVAEEPTEMILFQHAGGEKADWEDGKVRKEGLHPVVYPAAGSHATFYDSAVYVQNGQNGSGVGCDRTSEPVRRLALRPVLIPTFPTVSGPFKWLTFTGHWGQLEESFNNGPTGPTTKTQWQEPFTWMEEQRSTSPRLPGGSIVGGSAVGAFCGAVAAASDLINLDQRSHLAAILSILVPLILIGLIVGLTRWRPVDLDHLRRRRAFGQLIRAARQLYGRHWRVLLPVGLAALPIVGGVNLLAGLAASDRGVDDAKGGLHLALADLLEYIGRPIASAIVAAVVIVYVRELVKGERAGFVESWRGMLSRFWRVVGGQLLAQLGLLLLVLTVIGIPVAIYKYIGWQFIQQEILFDDKGVREAFRGSSSCVRGRWWHTVRVAGFLWLLSVAVGPVLGFVLIFLNFSLLWINLIGSLIFALFVPYVALGHTLLYFDLGARKAEEPARPRRRWLRWPRHPRPRRAAEPSPGIAATE